MIERYTYNLNTKNKQLSSPAQPSQDNTIKNHTQIPVEKQTEQNRTEQQTIIDKSSKIQKSSPERLYPTTTYVILVNLKCSAYKYSA